MERARQAWPLPRGAFRRLTDGGVDGEGQHGRGLACHAPPLPRPTPRLSPNAHYSSPAPPSFGADWSSSVDRLMTVTLLKNGRVIDPANGRDGVADVLIGDDGLIAQVGPSLDAGPDAPVMDCTGLVVAPGLIDMHVHLRVPGQEYKEDVASGTAAAANGGFTAIACQPNTSPPIDHASIVKDIRRPGAGRFRPRPRRRRRQQRASEHRTGRNGGPERRRRGRHWRRRLPRPQQRLPAAGDGILPDARPALRRPLRGQRPDGRRRDERGLRLDRARA